MKVEKRKAKNDKKIKNEKRKMKNEKIKTKNEKRKEKKENEKGSTERQRNLLSKKYPRSKKITASGNLKMRESVCERLSECKSE